MLLYYVGTIEGMFDQRFFFYILGRLIFCQNNFLPIYIFGNAFFFVPFYVPLC